VGFELGEKREEIPSPFEFGSDLRTIARHREWHYYLVRGCLCSSSPVEPPTPSETSPLS